MAHEKEKFIRFAEAVNRRHGKAVILPSDIDSFFSTLPEEKEENGWISVKNKLPEPKTLVITRRNEGLVDILYFNSYQEFEDKGINLTKYVTRWMPIPEFDPLNH